MAQLWIVRPLRDYEAHHIDFAVACGDISGSEFWHADFPSSFVGCLFAVISCLFDLGILHFAAEPVFWLALCCDRSHAVDFDYVAGLFTSLSYDDAVA